MSELKKIFVGAFIIIAIQMGTMFLISCGVEPTAQAENEESYGFVCQGLNRGVARCTNDEAICYITDQGSISCLNIQ